MRLFIAIKPPQQILEDLKKLTEDVKRGLPEYKLEDELKVENGCLRPTHSPWRFLDSQKAHLTLQFLSDGITHHKSDEITSALQHIVTKRFSIECRGVGAFSNSKKARVLWAGLKSLELESLAQKIRKTSKKLAIESDRDFCPHITIARSKFPSNISDFIEQNKGLKWSKNAWEVDSFYLIESVQELGGYEHKVLQKYSLL